jgi:hypothetical protein
MRTLRVAVALLAVLGLLACPTRRPEMEKFHKDNRVQRGSFPDVPAVVLLDRTELTFTFAPDQKRPYAALLHTRRIQLLEPEALELVKAQIPYDDRSRLLHIQARTTKPDGRVVDSPPDRYVELPRYKEGSPPAELYNDEGYKLTKVKGAEVGDVVELSYLRVFRDPRWVEPIRVGGDLPVVRGEIVVDHPRSFDVDYRVTKLGRVIDKRPTKIPQRIKGPDGEGEGVPGNRLVWVFENEQAIFPEEKRPETEALATQVHVQLKGYTLRNQRYDAYRSWNDVATWYRELTAGKDQPDSAVEQAVRKSGGKAGTKSSKLTRVQRWLQDKIADVPTFLNLAALPSHPPRDILRASIGDAKDQVSLGLAMLRHMGVDGFPVLVSRLGSFAVVPDLPTPAPFNHVIIAVPKGGAYHFIDPSTPALPVGRLPGPLQGQRALLVRPDRAELIDLPVDEASENTRSFEIELSLSRDGLAQGQMKVQLQGLDAAYARGVLRSGEDVEARLQELLSSGRGSPLTWQQVIPVGGKGGDPNKPLKLQVVLGAGQVATAKGGALTLNLEKILGKPLPALWREVRRMPLVFDHPYDERVRLSLSLPDTMGVEALPVEIRQDGELLNVEERWAISDGVLWLDRKLRLSARGVDPVDYTTLRGPVVQLWAMQANPLRIMPGGDRGASYSGDPF